MTDARTAVLAHWAETYEVPNARELAGRLQCGTATAARLLRELIQQRELVPAPAGTRLLPRHVLEERHAHDGTWTCLCGHSNTTFPKAVAGTTVPCARCERAWVVRRSVLRVVWDLELVG